MITRPQRLTDPRLLRRREQLVELATQAPSAGFPEMMGNEASLEACYRFFDNPRVSMDALLQEHFDETAQAAQENGDYLIIHDSSWFTFGGQVERKGLGRVVKSQTNNGFLGHFSLVSSADGRRVPLGLVAVSTRVLDGPAMKKEDWVKRMKDPNRAFARWGNAVAEAEARLGGGRRGIHVMDREADDYALLEQLIQGGSRFVIRLRHDRKVRFKGQEDFLRRVVSKTPYVLERDVDLTPRLPRQFGDSGNRTTHPVRAARRATLRVSSARVSLRRPALRRNCTEYQLCVNVVYVREATPPEGELPIEWLLVTTDPTDTQPQLEAVLDAYRGRWLIEEYFMALKTGCAYEQRQLETLGRLENALGILAPVAVGLLRLRHLAEQEPEAPATNILDPVELAALNHLSSKPLPPNLTAQQALFAVAALGGHLKRNGRPGWRTLHRGYLKLSSAAAVWAAAVRQRSDQ